MNAAHFHGAAGLDRSRQGPKSTGTEYSLSLNQRYHTWLIKMLIATVGRVDNDLAVQECEASLFPHSS